MENKPKMDGELLIGCLLICATLLFWPEIRKATYAVAEWRPFAAAPAPEPPIQAWEVGLPPRDRR